MLGIRSSEIVVGIRKIYSLVPWRSSFGSFFLPFLLGVRKSVYRDWISNVRTNERISLSRKINSVFSSYSLPMYRLRTRFLCICDATREIRRGSELNGRMNEIWIGTETMICNRNFVWTKCLTVVKQLKLGLNSTYTRLEGRGKKKYGSSIYEFIVLDLFSRNLHTCYISMNESFRTRSFLFMIYFYYYFHFFYYWNEFIGILVCMYFYFNSTYLMKIKFYKNKRKRIISIYFDVL